MYNKRIKNEQINDKINEKKQTNTRTYKQINE